jgi:hypothetical protein
MDRRPANPSATRSERKKTGSSCRSLSLTSYAYPHREYPKIEKAKTLNGSSYDELLSNVLAFSATPSLRVEPDRFNKSFCVKPLHYGNARIGKTA